MFSKVISYASCNSEGASPPRPPPTSPNLTVSKLALLFAHAHRAFTNVNAIFIHLSM